VATTGDAEVIDEDELRESRRAREERRRGRVELAIISLEIPYADDPIAQACVALGPLTLETIGELCGVTRERIRQIEDRAMDSFVRSAAELGLDVERLLEELRELVPSEPSGAWRL